MKDDFLCDLGRERLVAENDKLRLYSNDLTRACTKKARAMDIHGMELRGWTVLKAVSKDNPDDSFYLIFDNDGNPRMDTHTLDGMDTWVHATKVSMSYDYNIVDMAERLREEKE